MNLFWSKNPSVPNFGDDINPFIFSKLLGVEVNYVESNYKKDHYIGIGSILNYANKNSTVLGSGFIQQSDSVLDKPMKIIAVRGKETRNKLISSGISCPDIYGDVALLFPRIYNPTIEKKYKLGIIPHYIDKNNLCMNKLLEQGENVKIIDIQDTDHLKFIDDVLSCELIASSTLHGIIIADAYHIPSVWIEFSKNVIGNGFKFRDYFSSVGRESNSVNIKINTSIQEILDGLKNCKINFDSDKLFYSIKEQIII